MAYGPEQGLLSWLVRRRLPPTIFQARSCAISAKKIFVSDGSKCDSSNIPRQILRPGHPHRAVNRSGLSRCMSDKQCEAAALARPTRRGVTRLTYLPITAANCFCAALPEGPVDLIYLCFPTIPPCSGQRAAASTPGSNYALANQALIPVFDAAYEAFIPSTRNCPISIYEIEGAKQCPSSSASIFENGRLHGTRCALPRWCQTGLMGVGARWAGVELWSL